MAEPQLPAGTVHDTIPSAFQTALVKSPTALKLWHDITPLARNEWLCWLASGVKPETHERHLRVGISKLESGMRRPCCWMGCPHREKNGR